ncbi:farnesyl-diphosphate synthase [Clostridia bacterium]|nr:farnesyl-diphosphate synthase [Clostridia bacterium]
METGLTDAQRGIIKDKLADCASRVNSALDLKYRLSDHDIDTLYESERYSLLSGGKRIRAFLIEAFYELSGGSDLEKILPIQMAIESLHTYSLIHDDLPCMDDDDYRRGKPSNHKQYGEATALLAGDALLTEAFGLIAGAEFLPDAVKVRLVSELSAAAGHIGMIGGQMMDMSAGKDTGAGSLVRLIRLNLLKTGQLIIFSARAGCIAAGVPEELIELASEIAKNIGLSFQAIDDILDEGKEAEGKATFVSVLEGGAEAALEYAENLTAEAVLKLEEFSGYNSRADVSTIELFAKFLLERKS